MGVYGCTYNLCKRQVWCTVHQNNNGMRKKISSHILLTALLRFSFVGFFALVAMDRSDDVFSLYDSDCEHEEELFGDSDSESDGEDFQEGAVVCFAAAFTALAVRETFYTRQRLIWSELVQLLRRVLEAKIIIGTPFHQDNIISSRTSFLLRPRQVASFRTRSILGTRGGFGNSIFGAIHAFIERGWSCGILRQSERAG
jgi:hypothetical protein